MKESNTDSGVTAILSILKEPHSRQRTSKAAFSEDLLGQQHHYTILLWFIGQKVLLPPYLPRISATVEAGKRDDILNLLRALSADYLRKYGDHKLGSKESAAVLAAVRRVGANIASYPHELYDCLRFLCESEINIRYLVIHTDEHSIPWHLAYSRHLFEFDHLCDRYPCGTILVEDCDDALRRFINYNKSHRHPNASQKPKKYIYLVAGELGQTNEDGIDFGVAYVQRLKEFLERFEDLHRMKVRCIYPDNWNDYHGDCRRAVRKLDEFFDHAQIVHFTCHVVEEKNPRSGELTGKLKLSRDLKIGPEDLKDLSEFSSKPLVILHGCASVGPVAAGSEGAQLCKAFLYKGAGGCLATVLPVNIPTDLSEGAETLIEYFYRNVFLNDTYGVALHKARQSLRERSGLKYCATEDPQALFYQLFGDPREVLHSSRKETIADKIGRIQAEEPSTPSNEYIVRIAAESIDALEALNALRGIDGVEKVNLQPRVALLGPEPVTELPEFVFIVTAALAAYDVGNRIRKRFARAKVEGEKGQPLSGHVHNP